MDKDNETINPPKYSSEEEEYLKRLKTRLENARSERNNQFDEFDGMDYPAYVNQNEQLANTFIQAKRNKEDTNFQSGTIRTKLFALLSTLNNLDLTGDISAYDRNNFKIQELGDGMEDVILKTKNLDNDDEKKLMRFYELLKQGTVFVEESWDEKSKKVKKLKNKFNGKLKSASWTEKIKKAFARPTRNIIPNLNVYLGDITKYDISEQPYIFTVDSMPYSEAETIFREWDRWVNVPKKIQQLNETSDSIYNWRLFEKRENYVEIVRLQDKWDNEFAILINGILMTPVGLPLPWGYEDYNITQQNLEPIHSKFAYGKSLVFRIRNKVALLDEMQRLAILKTQKSYMPPYLNISGRVLSNRIFMPGKITYGIQPNTIIPINDKETQGVTQSELAMTTEIQKSIDNETTSPVFEGQQARGNPTATEIIQLQRQAKQMLGLTIFAASMLEWKLEWKRLKNILKNWFEPEDEVVDEARGILKKKFRQVGTEKMIEGEMGQRLIIPTTEIPTPEAVKTAEDILTEEKGAPIRLLFLNPEEIKSSELTWQITVKAKEKRTSETEKLLFRAFMQDAIPLNPNIGYLQERLASVWGENPKKLFGQSPEQTPQEIKPTKDILSPKNLPSPEKAAGRQIRNSLV